MRHIKTLNGEPLISATKYNEIQWRPFVFRRKANFSFKTSKTIFHHLEQYRQKKKQKPTSQFSH